MQEAPPLWFRRLRLRQLELLVEIGRQPTLTAAAAALHMTQPAVSQQLADIESAVGVALFERGRGLRATASGTAILRYARQVVVGARRTDEQILALQAGTAGEVRIGAMLVAATVLVPRVIRRLQVQEQGLRLRLEEDIMQGLWPRLERGDLDVVIGRLDARMRNGSLPFEALYDDPHCVVCRPGHPLSLSARPSWDAACAHRWVLPPEQTALRAAVEASFHAVGRATPVSALDSGSLAATLSLLQQTDWLAVVSGTAAAHYEAMGVLVALPLALSAEVGPVGMAWFDENPDPALARVLDALRHEARALVRPAAVS
jgi:DNA-binding transcriptional LysR family regulator